MLSPASPSLPVRPDVEDWRERAACRGLEASVFFSPDEERARARAAREARAQQICQDCPVLTACREHALSTDESYGIWGGMTENDRRRHARRRRRDVPAPSCGDRRAPAHRPLDSSR
jgi:hypothetical protein